MSLPRTPQASSPLPLGVLPAGPSNASSDTILDHLPDVVVRYDALGRVLYVNDAFRVVTGIDRAAVVGRFAEDLSVSPETIGAFAEARRGVFTTGVSHTFEIRRATTNGERRVQYQMVPERGADGQVETVVAIGRDVTELHLVSDQLRESERWFAAVLDNVPGIAYRLRYEGEWTAEFLSQGAVEITGRPAEALERGVLSYDDLVHPDDRAARLDAMRTALAAGVPWAITYRIVRDDGTLRWMWDQACEVSAGADGVRRVEGLAIDVTAREETRRALEAERARLTEAQRIARLGSWDWDQLTDMVSVTDDWSTLFGTRADGPQTADALFLSRLVPEDRERFETRRELVRTTRPTATEGRWRVVRADGSIIVVHMRTEWTYDADGTPVRARGTFQDVTAVVAQEELLARQQAMLEESQHLAGVGSWEIDVPTQAVTWSNEMYRIAGLPNDGTPMTIARVRGVVHPDDGPLTREALAESIATGGSTEYEFRLVRPDGEERIILSRTRAIAGADGAVQRVVGSCQDITERRRLEEQVGQSQKMEALGLLAGGVAHDFNNLLSAILGGAELARLGVPDDSEAAQDLDDVRHAATRAAQLTRQLLAFSRKQVRQPRATDLRDAVHGAEKLLRRLLPENVALDIATDVEPPVVIVDPSQLEQALLNLVVNARDAILATDLAAGRGMAGVISVRIERVTLAAGDRRLTRTRGPALAPGAYAGLVVSDTGAGIAPSVLPHVFEPFFTTKAPGKGTGIGLATVLEIATQSGGTVVAASPLGTGATFTILLPAVDAVVEAPGIGAAAPPTGSETILLVEDEAVVRETATRILERHGYHVIAARHGGDAMLAWREHGAAIQLVATDLRMPEVGGHSLIEQLRAERPSLPILIMSGYAGGKNPAEEAMLARETFLVKPFTSDSLLQHVRSAIDRKA